MCNEVSSLAIKQDPKTSGKYFCFQKAPFELENSSRKQMLLKFLNYGKNIFLFFNFAFSDRNSRNVYESKALLGQTPLNTFFA